MKVVLSGVPQGYFLTPLPVCFIICPSVCRGGEYKSQTVK